MSRTNFYLNNKVLELYCWLFESMIYKFSKCATFSSVLVLQVSGTLLGPLYALIFLVPVPSLFYVGVKTYEGPGGSVVVKALRY